jgi:hypothetical protein
LGLKEIQPKNDAFSARSSAKSGLAWPMVKQSIINMEEPEKNTRDSDYPRSATWAANRSYPN